MLPKTNWIRNFAGLRCASANTAALIMTATGVGTLQKEWKKHENKQEHLKVDK